jgi:RHS repeat-associated protein
MSARKTLSLISPLMRILLTFGLLLAATAAQAIERVTYYHNDALGSPVAATDRSGTLLWRESYAPYGERLTHEASSKNTVWYTGKQEEAAFGLNYFGARWYDPRIGRFMGVDPAGFSSDNIQSFNRYAYANNNPYAYVDPDGNVVETAVDIVSFGLSLAAFKSEQSLLNALGLAYDGAAVAIPFLPAGFGIVKNIGRGLDELGGVVKRADDYVDLASPQRRRHILDGDATGGGHRPGAGKPGKSEFPNGWSDDKIMHEISDVATDPKSATRAGRGGRTITGGTRDGVDIRVIQERNGDIVSGFPTNLPKNFK